MSEQPEPEGRRRAHEEFTAPGPLPPGADVEGAEAKLLGALERELGVPLAPGEADAGAPATPAPARGVPGRRRNVRPLLSLAAVILAAAGLLWSQDTLRRRREGELLRGVPPAEAPGAWAARPSASQRIAGGVRLDWAEAPGATRYAVTFLGEDLRERARVDSLVAPALELRRTALPAGLVSGRTVLWRVTAYVGADEIGRSPAVPLTLP